MVEALTLQDYPWQVHKQVKDTGVPDELSYINSWKYVIWILLAKRILQFENIRFWKFFDTVWWRWIFNENVRYIYRFLKQNYGNISPSFMEIIANRAREVRSIKLFNVAELSSNADSSPFERMSRLINIINSELQPRVLHLLSAKHKYYVLFDQLDLGWDNRDETKQLMIGLILAARDIVRAANRLNKNVHIVIFLRSDIYESLRFEDKNKLTQDVVDLRWDEPRLKDLATKRIEASAKGTWEDLFTGEAMRQNFSQISYIVQRTMLRPRDIIRYCALAKDIAQSQNKDRVDRESIYEAERPYSDYMRREIVDESKAMPVDIDVLFGILQDIHYNRVNMENFLDYCNSKGIDDASAALRQLLELSVFGVYKIGGSSRGSTFEYKYEALSWVTLEPSNTLAVHPSLKHALSLVEKRSSNRNSREMKLSSDNDNEEIDDGSADDED
ncbi:MAG: hypothetical protein OHK0022_38660 [Roseiflexaceae bacterium]